jgi:tetratricopeptide (TPR) repeat protein
MRPVVILVFALISFKSVPQKQFERLDSLAFYYVKNNDYVKAENTALETIQLSNGKNSSIYLINAHTILGIINKNRGYFHSSVENYLSAMKHAENISDSARVSACLNNIGVVYKLQNIKMPLSISRKAFNWKRNCLMSFKNLFVFIIWRTPIWNSIV